MAAHSTTFPIHLPAPSSRVGVALPVALSLGVHAALAALALWMQPAAAPKLQEEELVEITWLGGGMEPDPLGGGDVEEEEGPAIAQPAPSMPQPAAPKVAPPPPAPAPVEAPVVLAAAKEAEAEETIAVAQVEEPAAEEPVVGGEEPAQAEAPADVDRVDHLPKDRTLASLGAPPAGLGRGGGSGRGGGGGLGGGPGGGGFGDGIVDVRDAVTPPSVRQQKAPEYPRVAKRRGIEGTVLLRLVLDKDGKVETEHTRVLRSVPELDEAAIRAVSQWRFSPALDGKGQPLRVALQLPLRFTLR